MSLHIRFIGFGEAGRSFSESLLQLPGLSISAYDILYQSEGLEGNTAQAAYERGVTVCPAPDSELDSVDWIILAVTADSSVDAARSILPALTEKHTVLDINSVSPARKREAAALVEQCGARYADIAVMAPVRPRNHGTPLLVAGVLRGEFLSQLTALDFNFEVVGNTPGEATAVKMVRSVFIKGLEALTAQTLLAAERSGCFDRILASLSHSYPGLNWQEFPQYQVERMLTHGVRRAAEMRESARTMDELGYDGELVRQIAGLQALMGAASVSPEQALSATLAAINAEFAEGA